MKNREKKLNKILKTKNRYVKTINSLQMEEAVTVVKMTIIQELGINLSNKEKTLENLANILVFMEMARDKMEDAVLADINKWNTVLFEDVMFAAYRIVAYELFYAYIEDDSSEKDEELIEEAEFLLSIY